MQEKLKALPYQSIDIVLAFIVFAGLLVLQPRYTYLKYHDIDPSFGFGLNQATIQHQRFGTQFISTYGPLSYFDVSYLPQLINKGSVWLALYVCLLGLGVYLFLNGYQLFSDTDKRLQRYLLAGLLIYCLAIPQLEWRFLALFILYDFIYLRYKKWRPVLLVGLSFFAAVFLYIKFSLGVAAFGSLLLLAANGFNGKKPSLKTSFMTIAGVVALSGVWLSLLALPVHASLALYIKEGLLFTFGYSGAMSYTMPGYLKGDLLLALLFAAVLAYVYLYDVAKKNLVSNALKFGFLLVPMFFAWKNAVVRQDPVHILLTMLFLVPLVLMIFLVRLTNQKHSKNLRQQALGILPAVVIGLLLLINIFGNKLGFQNTRAQLLLPANNVPSRGFVKFFNNKSSKQDWAVQSNVLLQTAKLPPDMRQTIGNSTVDIFPWEATIVYANSLNWKNRPAPFSFENYKPFLDNKNASFFNSSDAPDFVLWHNFLGVEGIDHRNILWDEPNTVKSLLTNYKLVQATDNFIALSKKPVLQQPHTTVVESGTAAWDQWIKVPTTKVNTITFINGTYKKSALVDAKELLVRGETVNIALQYSDGTVREYRFVPSNLGQGFVVNPMPQNWAGLGDFLQNAQNNQSKVTQVKFTASNWYQSHSGKVAYQFTTQQL